MRSNVRVYMIYGQGGYTFSAGFHKFGLSLREQGFDVPFSSGRSFWGAREPNLVINDILRNGVTKKIALLGFSLGGNGATWVASGYERYGVQGLNPRNVDFIMGFDPTVNEVCTPLTHNVKRAISTHQRAWWFPTSTIFGRAFYTAAPGGPDVSIIPVYMDHLYVQSARKLQDMALDELIKLA